MKKLIITLLAATSLLGCATNKYDAEIANAKFDYGKTVNAQKKVFEIKCDQKQKDENKCGIFGEVVVYQSNQGYIDVDPQRKNALDYGVEILKAGLPFFFQYKMNESNNEWGFKRQQSSDNMFSGMFDGLANVKGSGVTNNDYSQTSSTTDSYNSADNAFTNSYNTTSGDTATDSYNTTNNTSANTESSNSHVQGDTISTVTTSESVSNVPATTPPVDPIL